MVKLGISTVLAAMAVLFVAGCSGSSDDQYGTKAPPVTTTSNAPTPMTDKKTGAQTHNLGSRGMGVPNGPGGGLGAADRK